MTGRVYLVGAGPGDPGLLTLRGQRCLAAADVVVHDALVHPRLLEHVQAGAEVITVGKPHGEGARLSQEEVETLLIAHARAGRTVVRLKNGDPMLFGRGGEEAQVLRRAGVPFEVVPGVTAALAVPAYAGIPATHRDHASLITIVTGHQKADGNPPALPWEALARQGGTLVFLMGMSHLAAITGALVAHGLDPATPAAAIVHGTTGRQATVVGTVATLPRRVRDAQLAPPGVVVIGHVVGLRDAVGWFEARPLFGRRVVVTRPRTQAGELARCLEDAGAEVVLFPTIAIGPPTNPAALERAVDTAGSHDWLVFTSVNGVRTFFEVMDRLGRDLRELAGVQIAAIGPETAAELGRRMLRPAVVPEEFRAEGLLAALGETAIRGKRILLPRAAGARDILPATLAARGAVVEEVQAYRAVVPDDLDVESMRAALREGSIDALTFTSSSTVANFLRLVGPEVIEAIVRTGRPVIACIGPVTAETARQAGLAVAVCPPDYTVPALARALIEHLHRG